MDGPLDTDAAREHLLTDRRSVVEATLKCADAVVSSWSAKWTTDREEVVGPLGAALSESGLLGAYPSVLAECVEAAGGKLRAEPVAAPPYVVVTTRGPVLRATLAPGRLVATLGVFEVERSERGPRYARSGTTPEAVVGVEVR